MEVASWTIAAFALVHFGDSTGVASTVAIVIDTVWGSEQLVNKLY